MKKYLLLLSFVVSFAAAKAQTVNFSNMCVLNIGIDTVVVSGVNNYYMLVTIANLDTNSVNYPTVVVTNSGGDTVGNINSEFYLFAHLAGDTVTHSIPTSLTNVPAGFTGSVYFTDQIWDTTYMFSYPMICTVGIHEAYASNRINVYPNPATDVITVDIEKLNNKQAVITIYDIAGKELKSYTTPENRLTINRDGLQSGIYFISVIADDKRYTSKLIVR